MPLRLSVRPVAIQTRALEEIGIIDAPEPAAPAPGGSIHAGIDNHLTIPANDDHHLRARRCGRNRSLDLSGKDDPRKAGLRALRAHRLGTERDAMSSATNVMGHGVVLSAISRAALQTIRSFSSSHRRRRQPGSTTSSRSS
jgi:hypothetical protein